MEITRLIPQLFYDFIARVIPGLIIIVGLSLATKTDLITQILLQLSDATKFANSMFVQLLSFGLAGYIIGHMIGPLGDVIYKTISKYRSFKPYFKVLEVALEENSGYPEDVINFLKEQTKYNATKSSNNGGNNSGSEVKNKIGPILFIWSDWIRLEVPEAGARLVKLRAEYRMHLGNCVAGLLISSTALFCINTEIIQYYIILIVSGLVLAILSVIAHTKSYRLFQWSVINTYYSVRGLGKQTAACADIMHNQKI